MDIQFKVYGIGYGVQGIREKIQEFGFNVTLRSVFFKMIEFLYPGSRLVLPQFPISSFQFQRLYDDSKQHQKSGTPGTGRKS